MKKNIVIKIGGSLLFDKTKEINAESIENFCNVINDTSDFEKIVIVCGGGIIAREYIGVVRKFTNNEALCDLFGIDLSRINSKLIIAGLKDMAYPRVPESIEELSTALLSKEIIVMGGLQPGQSTTSVALEVSEYINAEKLVILTDVDGIYDKDPKKHKDAKLQKKLTYKEVQNIVIGSGDDKQAAAGEYRIFDAVSLQILKRSNIPVVIMNGNNLSEFKKLLKGESDFIRTLITK